MPDLVGHHIQQRPVQALVDDGGALRSIAGRIKIGRVRRPPVDPFRQASRPVPRHYPDRDTSFREQGREHAADLPRAENHVQPAVIHQRNRRGDGLGGTHFWGTVRHRSSRPD